MDISSISCHKQCCKAVFKIVDKYEEQWCTASKNGINDASLHICDDLTKFKFVPNKYHMYILANNPKKSVDKILSLPLCRGELIFTLVGESKMLYSSKTSAIISEFLEEEAYLTSKQSKRYFTAFQECLINAIEHGSFSLGDKKKEHLHPDHWFDQDQHFSIKNLNSDDGAKKLIAIQCFLNDGLITTSITDEGDGFDTSKLETNLIEGFKAHGRGIILAQAITDALAYKDDGKCVEFSFKAGFLDNTTALSVMEDRSNAIILLVDDQMSNLEIAKFYLESSGYKNIYFAISGEEALELASEVNPDIIIMDVVMPKMDGFMACRKIKQIPECKNVPLLFFTSLTDAKSRIKGYRLGAVDYVTKPIQRSELVARTDIHIQHSLMVKSLNKYIDKMHDDLDRAKDAQLELLPNLEDIEILQHKYDVGINSCFNTCDKLAGDYWTIKDLGFGEIGVILADFTGHGIAASLNTVRLHALIKECSIYLKSPKDFIYHINEKLKHLIPMDDFATFIYGILNVKTDEFTYIGCGNPPIALLPIDRSKPCKLLSCEGIPLGLVDNNQLTLELKTVKLEKGDSLFFYSDALLETRHADDNEMWGEKGLLRELSNIQKNSIFPVLSDVLVAFKKTAIQPLKDDLTMLFLTYKAGQINEGLLRNYTRPDALQQELLG